MKKMLVICVGAILISCGRSDVAGCEIEKVLSRFEETVELSSPLAIGVIESSKQIEMPDSGDVVTFGYINKEWEEFKSSYTDGDCIFAYYLFT